MVLFQKGKSYKLPKVVNRDNGNLRAEPPSRSIGRSQAGRGKGGGWFGGLCPTAPEVIVQRFTYGEFGARHFIQ